MPKYSSDALKSRSEKREIGKKRNKKRIYKAGGGKIIQGYKAGGKV